jgi:hypothetical protein
MKVAETLDKDSQKKATSVYESFKKDINDLDYACGKRRSTAFSFVAMGLLACTVC